MTREVFNLATGVDPDRPRVKHDPGSRFPWKITRGTEYIRLSDGQMTRLVGAVIQVRKAAKLREFE